jgi:hypothetical protein
MEDVKNKRCEHDGCKKQPHYGLPGDAQASRCAAHKLEGMGNVKSKRCAHEGCKKHPSYGAPGDARASRCAAHKLEGMENVKSKRCEHEGCKKLPSFGIPGGTQASRCAAHKLEGMENVKSKRCEHEGCKKVPCYGFPGIPGDTQASRCVSHKLEGMENVVSKRCEHEGCKTLPNFGFPGGRASRCAAHKLEGMENVVSKRCEHEGCKTLPNFGFPGDTQASRCAAHKLEGMEDVVSKRCAHEGCTTSASNTNYKGFCLRCFVYLHPDQKVARNYKIKERHVIDALAAVDLGLPAGVVPACDKRVDGTGGCGSLRRPDWLVDLGSHSLIVEVDEEQHIGYDTTCETKRLMQLFGDLGDRPLVVLRFNPDAYTDAGGRRVASPFKHHARLGVPVVARHAEWDARVSRLVDVVRGHVARGLRDGAPSREVTVEPLFFDGTTLLR